MSDAVAKHGVFYGEHHFHPLVEVAGHPVGARKVDFFLATVRKVKDAAVLEETADDASHVNAFADSANSGPKSTHTSYQEIDLHSRLRRAIEGGDNVLIE